MQTERKILVRIREEKTGVVAEYETVDDGDDAGTEFMWCDGNYGCDCNRYLFFTAGLTGVWPNDSSDETPCGAELYAVQIVDKNTDRLIYEDEDWTR